MVEAGFRGELVSRLLLLEAYATAYFASSGTSPGPIPLHVFLDHLYQPPAGKPNWEEYFKGLADSKSFLGYKVFLTHFTYVTYEVKDSDIHQFFLRGSGIHCRRNQKGIDHIIPLYNSVTKESSYILISVKNQQRVSNESKHAAEVANPKAVKVQSSSRNMIPFVILWMEVQPELDPEINFEDPGFKKGIKKSPRLVNRTTATRPHLLIQSFGLKELFVMLKDENLCDKMSKLALSFPDPIKVHQSLGSQVNNVDVLKYLLRHSYHEEDASLKRKFDQVEPDFLYQYCVQTNEKQ
jgi:hypothetical protein